MDLIEKMGRSLTDAQQQFYLWLLSACSIHAGETASDYIARLIRTSSDVAASKKGSKGTDMPEDLSDIRSNTMNAVKRSLEFVRANLVSMERNNERLRSHHRFKSYDFEELPDAWDAPDQLVRPGQVSVLYLAGSGK